jgi:hypothetical protein
MTLKREKILKNAAECPLCHDVIESVHRHDFVSCSCGSISVDGGKEYTRRMFKTGVFPIERSEILYEDYVLPDYSVDVSNNGAFDTFREDLLQKCDDTPKPKKKRTPRTPLPKKSTVPRRMGKRKTVKKKAVKK